MVLSAGGMCSTLLLLPAFQKWQLGFFFGLFLSFVQNLPQRHLDAVIFSPIQFLCILLLEERCVQVQHCSTAAEGPRSQTVSTSSQFTNIFLPRFSSVKLDNSPLRG